LFADKYLYFAGMGVALILAGAADKAQTFLGKPRGSASAGKLMSAARGAVALVGMGYILFLMGSLYSRQQHFSDDVSFWRQAAATSDNPTGEVLVNLGEAHFQAGEMEEARERFGSAARDARNPVAQVEALLWWSLTELAFDESSWATGLMEEAETAFRRPGFLAPGNLPYAGLLASGQVKLANPGALDRAEFSFGVALGLREWSIPARLYIADVFCLKGFLRAAVHMLREAHDIDPSDPEVLARLTFVLRELRDPAYKVYEQKWARAQLSSFQVPRFLGLAQLQQYYDHLRAVHHDELPDTAAFKGGQEEAVPPQLLSEQGTGKPRKGAPDGDHIPA